MTFSRYSAVAGASLLGLAFALQGCGDAEPKTTAIHSLDQTVNGFRVPDDMLYVADAPDNVVMMLDNGNPRFFLITGEAQSLNHGIGGQPELFTRKGRNYYYTDYLDLEELTGSDLERYTARQAERLKLYSDIVENGAQAGSMSGAGSARGLGGTDFNISSFSGVRVIDIYWGSFEEIDGRYRVALSKNDKTPGVFTIQALASSWHDVYASAAEEGPDFLVDEPGP